MLKDTEIKSWCRISSLGLVSGIEKFKFEEDSKGWKQLYRHFQGSYTKIFKMDDLCKYAYIAVEALKRQSPIATTPGVYFANSTSSYDSDRAHLNALMESGEISPAVFVYTLPNIAIGEIAIANQWHCPSQCEIHQNFKADYFLGELDFFMKAHPSLNDFIFLWVDVVEGIQDVLAFHIQRQQNKDVKADQIQDWYQNI